ncbi:large subunit ribosomal protein L6 [Chitinophaga ginsengisegetis]|jgi:large subunit ribosomal protein L6|uniref:Large ribosomal subunit protein uL6 n=1 Tax=Chitinophaga ginsengisegetis TaxID=393003 RepID=A0A1T5P1M5_9BACT|nr:50S ribosomal protein L6 [Chitinophaga ginsengisegetis]MDR6566775.1 large subunit ribosomal protein L6 [Chitinophaga ginsengisegetis]MDR6646505.1 large subunit ribosomal protein L6 [Chitinophaga ginsengisegetis]MDR6652855.1 large subunit ribosomal protein L6 [Chitinophaga ginsengisegetis]SKD06612.1 large subunit ribosomal protein L6 [Chitinophaga ginsengisegetis]
MSRIGKSPIKLASGVTVTVSPSNEVTVKGPKGELKKNIDREMKIEVKDGVLTVIRPTEQIRHKALHGLYRALLANMVQGVTEGFKKQLELVGVGYKAANNGQLLDLALGYSHNIVFEIPKELKVATLTEKGQNPKIMLEGIDNQLLGQVAAKIRGLRKPEPYKGKGVRYSDEVVRKKAGKSAGK